MGRGEARLEESGHPQRGDVGRAHVVEQLARIRAVEQRASLRCDDTCSQKVRRRATRLSGVLPAMMAALIAPIEMPATQSGALPASASAFVDARLIGAERAAALQHEHGALARACR